MSKLSDLLSLAVGGVVVVGAVLSSSLISNNLVKQGGVQVSSSEAPVSSSEAPKPQFNPIDDAMIQIADEFVYEVDPLNVVIPEQEEWDYDVEELKSVPYDKNRSGHDLIYYFIYFLHVCQM